MGIGYAEGHLLQYDLILDGDVAFQLEGVCREIVGKICHLIDAIKPHLESFGHQISVHEKAALLGNGDGRFMIDPIFNSEELDLGF